jgi:Uncharacterized conserved protein
LAFVEQVSASIADAMKKHDAVRLSTLRMLKAALMNREIERGHTLDEGESLQVVASLVKQRRDSIEQFTQGGRPELADKEQAEIHILETYLPQRLSRLRSSKPLRMRFRRPGPHRPKTWAES